MSSISSVLRIGKLAQSKKNHQTHSHKLQSLDSSTDLTDIKVHAVSNSQLCTKIQIAASQ